MREFISIALLLVGVVSGEFDQGFTQGRTYPAEIGDSNAEIFCRATHPIESRTCRMTMPDMVVLDLDLETGEVSSGGILSEEFTAYTDAEERLCSLNINTVDSTHLGQWRCDIDQESHLPEFGSIALLNNEMSFVRDVRLPRHTVPEHYDITLIPFIIEGNYTIKGELNVSGMIQETDENNCDYKCIVLHTRDTYINEDSIVVGIDDDILYKVISVGYDIDRDFVIIYLDGPMLTDTPFFVKFEFVSQLQDNLAGFYRSSYVDRINNVTKTIGTTQFESTDARRAFPCFDEPDMKAVFRIKLGRRKDMITLSNMESNAGEVIDDEYVLDIYEPSVKMSTYLLAFIVCEFGSVHDEGHENFKIWAQEDRIPELTYAAKIGPQITEFYEELFDYKFPLNKMDMAAIPDFQSGAMENWGLITYRDTAILYDETNYALKSKERVATVVAHELAHQWFGDLVTMKWWNDLWLNEGFASYIEYLGADHVEPDMRLIEQQVNLDMQDVFFLDALPSSHPISVNIENPVYQENFDRISYGKGSILIRMMSNFLTPATFHQGLANYFKEHAYSNAEQDDLWNSLGDQAHVDGVLPDDVSAKQIMDTWTLQKGYPVLQVVHNKADGKFELKQMKFNLQADLVEKEEFTWWVPVTYQSVKEDMVDSSVKYWLNTESESIEAPANEEDDLYIFNTGAMGYYRVNYEESVWNQIAEVYSSIPVLSRSQILDDAMNLARAGQLSYDIALGLTSSLATEEDVIVVKAFRSALDFLDKMVSEDERYGNFKNYIRVALQGLYEKVSASDNSDFIEVLLKTVVLPEACAYENQDCIDKAKEQFDAWKMAETDYETVVDPNIKAWAYCYGIKYGTPQDWDMAWDRLQKTSQILERDSIIAALGCTSDPALLNKYLDLSIDPTSVIRTQNKRYLYSSIGSSKQGSKLMLDWLETNWETIKEFYADTFVYNVAPMLTNYPLTANTQEEFDRMNNFFNLHRGELGSSADPVQQGLDKIAANVKWREQFYDQVLDWFVANAK